MRALMVLLPDWREQLRRMRPEWERSRSSCHPSGWMPNALANATLSRANLRSSLTSTITPALQSTHNGLFGLWVGIQGLDDQGARLDVLGVQAKVEGRRAVQLFGDLSYQLEVAPCLPDCRKRRTVFVGFLGSLKDSQRAALQSLYAVEEGVRPGSPLGVRCQGDQLRDVPT